jgi:hypothetical protein
LSFPVITAVTGGLLVFLLAHVSWAAALGTATAILMLLVLWGDENGRWPSGGRFA